MRTVVALRVPASSAGRRWARCRFGGSGWLTNNAGPQHSGLRWGVQQHHRDRNAKEQQERTESSIPYGGWLRDPFVWQCWRRKTGQDGNQLFLVQRLCSLPWRVKCTLISQSQFTRGCETLARIFCQGTQEHLIYRWRQGRIDGRGWYRLFSQMFQDHSYRRRGLERKPPREHLIQQHTERIHIACRRSRMVHQFWSHIQGSAK